MASREVYRFQVTIPAGTAQTTPFRQDTVIPVRTVNTVEIRVPPGPSGLMGFALTMGGVNVLPQQAGAYIVTDDESISWPLDGLPDTGAWQLTGYNTDVFDHTVYLRFLVDVVPAGPSTSAVGGASLADLSSF